MKFLVLLFALAVYANAQRPSSIVVKPEIVENIEIQSPSATIVTELFETTFQVPAELAKEIGHIFRNVPLSLAKEMVAFIVKAFGDSNSNHLESFSQNPAQAAHIFGQVWENIDVNEVISLVNSEILPSLLTEIIVKIGPFARDAIDFANNFVFGDSNTKITLRQTPCTPGCYYPMPDDPPCYQGNCPDGCCRLG